MELFPYVDLKNQLSRKLDSAAVGAPGGVAKLGSDGRVPFAQLPPTLAELSGVVEYRENKGKPGGYASLSGAGVVPASQLPSSFPPAPHTHSLLEVESLEFWLNSLASMIAGKAAKEHTHEIADVDGLQTALDGKAPAEHSHTIWDVTGLQAELDAKGPAEHSHAIADVDGLTFELTELQTEIDGKAPAAHTHGYTDLPRVVATAYYIDGEWEDRPTSDLDVPVWWIGGSLADPPPAPGPRDIHFPDAD